MRPWAKSISSWKNPVASRFQSGGEQFVGLGGVFLDRHEIVGPVGFDDHARGLAGGVQRVDGPAPRSTFSTERARGDSLH